MNTDGILTIRLFAQAREAAGQERLELTAPGPLTVGELRVRLAGEHPQIKALLPRCAIAINRAYASDSQTLKAGDEVAVIPPVAGG
jgi:molybdopterin converting factor subunit 1